MTHDQRQFSRVSALFIRSLNFSEACLSSSSSIVVVIVVVVVVAGAGSQAGHHGHPIAPNSSQTGSDVANKGEK